MICNLGNPVTITSLEKFKFGSWKSLNNQDLMFQSRNVEASKSSSGSYRYLTHTTDKKMERKTRYEVQELACLIWNRWQYEIYYWWRFRTLVSWQNQRNGYVREIGIWWSVTRSILQSLVRFDVRRRYERLWTW